MTVLSLVFVMLLVSGPCFSLPVDKVPNPKNATEDNWVMDRAHKISPDVEAKINAQLSTLSRKKSVEMAFVTVPDISPEVSIEDYANKLFKRWGIGSSSTDKGILFLWSPGDRKVRYEVGYGLEAQIPDIVAKKILDEKVIPYLKDQTQYGNDKAAKNAVQGIYEALNAPPYKQSVYFRWAVYVGGAIYCVYAMYEFIKEMRRPNPTKSSGSSSSYLDDDGGSWGGGDSGGGGASDDY